MPAAMSQVHWGIDDGHDVADKPTIGMGTNGGALSGHQEPINRTPGDHAHSHTRINREKPHICNRIYICICISTYINV